jgi:hypothetical protein
MVHAIEQREFLRQRPDPSRFAFAVLNPGSHVSLSDNRNPHLAWSDISQSKEAVRSDLSRLRRADPTDDVNHWRRQSPATSIKRAVRHRSKRRVSISFTGCGWTFRQPLEKFQLVVTVMIWRVFRLESHHVRHLRTTCCSQ